MRENKLSMRLFALPLAFLVMSALIFTGFARAWAQDATQNKHIDAVSFNLIGYESGQTADSVQVGSQTSNVFAESKKFLQSDPNADDWKDATGKFAPEFKYRVKITFSAKSGYDFTGLVKEKITLETGESAVEYDAAKKVATFDLKRILANYTLTFNTNDGSAIAPVTKPENTVIDLADYTPTKKGFKFEGWYAQAELTQKMTQVTLSKNTTVYAKWVKEESSTPNKPNPKVPGDSNGKKTTPSDSSQSNASNGSGDNKVNPDSETDSAKPNTAGSSTNSSDKKDMSKENKKTEESAKLPGTGSESWLMASISALMVTAGVALIVSRRRNGAFAR